MKYIVLQKSRVKAHLRTRKGKMERIKEYIRVGFTGTQKGMTDNQKQVFIEFIKTNIPKEFHHGDCIGADSDAHELVKKYSPNTKIVIHPPSDTKKRAFKSGELLGEKDYLARNKDIVETTDVLVAAPKTEKEELRSGTWSTVRHARKLNRKIVIV
jgi:hypothetical protein